MRLLLPPSESKNDGSGSMALDLETLSFADLSPTRTKLATALQKLSNKPRSARSALGISEKQDFERERNLALFEAPTSPAADIYCGVLYDSLNLAGFTVAQRKRADARIMIQSALFGWVTPADRIPAYRLSGDTTLPRLGSPATTWKKPLANTLDDESLIIDLRSGTYAKFWQPRPEQLDRTIVIKVMQQVTDTKGTRKIAVSHFNKATKGVVARDLITANATPQSVADVIDVLKSAGWEIEHSPATGKSAHHIEVIIEDLVPQR